MTPKTLPPIKIPVMDLRPATVELRTELDQAYREVMDSGLFLLGPQLDAFEQEYAASVGVGYCLGVANGLEALQLVLLAWEIGPGDEVIVPAHGYIATWLAATHCGSTIVPCECDERTYNLDPERLEKCLTAKTKVIIPIHLYGVPADMDTINALAQPRGIRVLEDGAQSHGALYRGRCCGSLGDAAGISFYPSKNLGALADAGAVLTNDARLAEKVRHLRNYGAKIRYQNKYLGMNSRLEELQAAFLRVKLRHLADWNARRQRLADIYFSRLGNLPELTLPHVPAQLESTWHLFVVRTTRREALQSHLRNCGIGTQVHYPTPPHLSEAYAHCGWKRGDFPLAEKLADEVLSLPISPHHTPGEIEEVCAAVQDFFRPPSA